MGSDLSATFYRINGNKIIGFSNAYPTSVTYPVTCDYRGGGFLLGIVSVVKNKDRSILTLLAILIGLLIILWAVAEIVFPH